MFAALCVAGGEHLQGGRGGGKLALREIAGNQFLRVRKFGNWSGLGGLARSLVVFDKLVAVGAKNERDVIQFADTIFLALLQAVFRQASFPLGFQDGKRNRLTALNQWTAQNVIRASSSPAMRFAINDVNLSGSCFNPDIAPSIPAASVQSRINQLISSLVFVAVEQFGWHSGFNT